MPHVRRPLTESQREVVRLVMRGCETHDTATALGLKVRTVKARLNSIYKVMGITNRYYKRVRLIHLLYAESRERRGE